MGRFCHNVQRCQRSLKQSREASPGSKSGAPFVTATTRSSLPRRSRFWPTWFDASGPASESCCRAGRSVRLRSRPAPRSTSCPRPLRFARAPGPSRRFRPISSAAPSRSRVPSNARWSSTRSTRARTASWPTSRIPTRRRGTTTCRGRSTCATRCAGPSRSTIPRAARNTDFSSGPRRSSSGRAGFTFPNAISSSTDRRCRGASSTSAFTSFTTRTR